MSEIPVSVVIVSRERPAALQRCLTGLEQIFYENFEVVVVADGAGCDAVRVMGLADAVKLMAFDQPNISAARNLGIARAAGDVVAFIDDDAVPEPTWLAYLAEGFADPAVASAGGPVRGRNGISFQNTARLVHSDGSHTQLAMPEAPRIISTFPGNALKTEGTNCAFRRSVLADIGGFDEAFRFFLDETDVNLRLADRSMTAVFAPHAEVHHGFLESAYRRDDRMPKTLFEIGASQAVFLRKHRVDGELDALLSQFKVEQRQRLIRHMVSGTCEPRDVGRLMQTLDDGISEGLVRPFGKVVEFSEKPDPFRRFVGRTTFTGSTSVLHLGLSARDAMAAAAKDVASGQRISVFLFSRTAFFHRVSFENGVWLQKGGLYGRSKRTDKLFKMWRKKPRYRREIARVSKQRSLNSG